MSFRSVNSSKEESSSVDFSSSAISPANDELVRNGPIISPKPSEKLHESENKVDVIFTLLSVLTERQADIGHAILNLSAESSDNCSALRQSGCLSLLVQLLHDGKSYSRSDESLDQRPAAEVRLSATNALYNIVKSNPDTKTCKRELRVLSLLTQIRAYCELLHCLPSHSNELLHPSHSNEQLLPSHSHEQLLPSHSNELLHYLPSHSNELHHFLPSHNALCQHSPIPGDDNQSDSCVNSEDIVSQLERCTVRPHCDSTSASVSSHEKQACEQKLAPSVALLMKLSFDEDYRYAICLLGGVQALSDLIELDTCSYGVESDVSEWRLTMRYHACMALTNLTCGDANNKTLLCGRRSAVTCLIDQLRAHSEDLRQVSASVVRNLSWCADTRSKEVLKDCGAVKALLYAALHPLPHSSHHQHLTTDELLKVMKESTLKSLLSALWNLSAHSVENKSVICDTPRALELIISSLSYKSRTTSQSIVENGGGILRMISSQIAVKEEYRKVLRDKNCLKVLLQHLQSPSLVIVSNACGTLWNLSARCQTDQNLLRELGAVSLLRNLIHSNHRLIAIGSATALKNLIYSFPNETGACGCVDVGCDVDKTERVVNQQAVNGVDRKKDASVLQHIDQNLNEQEQAMDCSAAKSVEQQKRNKESVSQAHKPLQQKHNLMQQQTHNATHQQSRNPTTHQQMYNSAHQQIQQSRSSTHQQAHNPAHQQTHNSTYQQSHNPTHQQTHNSTHQQTHNPTHQLSNNSAHQQSHNPTHQSHNPTHQQLNNPLHQSHNAAHQQTHNPIPQQSRIITQQQLQPIVQQSKLSSVQEQQIRQKSNLQLHQQQLQKNQNSPKQLHPRLNRPLQQQPHQLQLQQNKRLDNSNQQSSNDKLFMSTSESSGLASGGIADNNGNQVGNRKNSYDSFNEILLQDTSNDQPVNFSLKFAEREMEEEIEDEDEAVNYCMKYSEEQECGDDLILTSDCKPKKSVKPNNAMSGSSGVYSCDVDTVKTFATEGTPLTFLSNATSMSDLSYHHKDSKDYDIVEPSHSALRSDNMSDSERCGAKFGENEGQKSTTARNELNSGVSESTGMDEGVKCEGDLERLITYNTEGTPITFSRTSSLSSLPSHHSTSNSYRTVPSTMCDSQKNSKSCDDVRNQEQDFCSTKLPREDVTNQSDTERTAVDSKSLVVSRDGSGLHVGGASKTVTFDMDHLENITPMMFSRCSSLGSLSSFDAHSVHSSVMSEYSRRTSEVVSPSDLPDSPGNTVPSSPSSRHPGARSGGSCRTGRARNTDKLQHHGMAVNACSDNQMTSSQSGDNSLVLSSSLDGCNDSASSQMFTIKWSDDGSHNDTVTNNESNAENSDTFGPHASLGAHSSTGTVASGGIHAGASHTSSNGVTQADPSCARVSTLSSDNIQAVSGGEDEVNDDDIFDDDDDDDSLISESDEVRIAEVINLALPSRKSTSHSKPSVNHKPSCVVSCDKSAEGDTKVRNPTRASEEQLTSQHQDVVDELSSSSGSLSSLSDSGQNYELLLSEVIAAAMPQSKRRSSTSTWKDGVMDDRAASRRPRQHNQHSSQQHSSQQLSQHSLQQHSIQQHSSHQHNSQQLSSQHSSQSSQQLSQHGSQQQFSSQQQQPSQHRVQLQHPQHRSQMQHTQHSSQQQHVPQQLSQYNLQQHQPQHSSQQQSHQNSKLQSYPSSQHSQQSSQLQSKHSSQQLNQHSSQQQLRQHGQPSSQQPQSRSQAVQQHFAVNQQNNQHQGNISLLSSQSCHNQIHAYQSTNARNDLRQAASAAGNNSQQARSLRGFVDFSDDTVKSYTLEETPTMFSQSTSLSNLSIDSHYQTNAVLERDDVTVQKSSAHENKQVESYEHCRSYCVEDTPAVFSRNDSLSSLEADNDDEDFTSNNNPSFSSTAHTKSLQNNHSLTTRLQSSHSAVTPNSSHSQSVIAAQNSKTVRASNSSQSVMAPNSSKTIITSNSSQSVTTQNGSQTGMVPNSSQSVIVSNSSQTVMTPSSSQSVMAPHSSQVVTMSHNSLLAEARSVGRVNLSNISTSKTASASSLPLNHDVNGYVEESAALGSPECARGSRMSDSPLSSLSRESVEPGDMALLEDCISLAVLKGTENKKRIVRQQPPESSLDRGERRADGSMSEIGERRNVEDGEQNGEGIMNSTDQITSSERSLITDNDSVTQMSHVTDAALDDLISSVMGSAVVSGSEELLACHELMSESGSADMCHPSREGGASDRSSTLPRSIRNKISSTDHRLVTSPVTSSKHHKPFSTSQPDVCQYRTTSKPITTKKSVTNIILNLWRRDDDRRAEPRDRKAESVKNDGRGNQSRHDDPVLLTNESAREYGREKSSALIGSKHKSPSTSRKTFSLFVSSKKNKNSDKNSDVKLQKDSIVEPRDLRKEMKGDKSLDDVKTSVKMSGSSQCVDRDDYMTEGLSIRGSKSENRLNDVHCVNSDVSSDSKPPFDRKSSGGGLRASFFSKPRTKSREVSKESISGTSWTDVSGGATARCDESPREQRRGFSIFSRSRSERKKRDKRETSAHSDVIMKRENSAHNSDVMITARDQCDVTEQVWIKSSVTSNSQESRSAYLSQTML